MAMWIIADDLWSFYPDPRDDHFKYYDRETKAIAKARRRMAIYSHRVSPPQHFLPLVRAAATPSNHYLRASRLRVRPGRIPIQVIVNF
jgi:hypothetical protein